MNIFEQQAKALKLVPKARQGNLNDADVKCIKDSGLSVVHKPDSNVSSIAKARAQQEARRMQICTSPEAA